MSEEISEFSGDYDFLSNFYLSPIIYRRHTYDTVEHAYQATKAVTEDDRKALQQARSPGQAKRLGRKVKARSDWESVKVSVMLECLQRKFAYGTDLARRLLATGTARLVEGNTWGDTFWGVYNGKGRNRLGELLMQVRAELQERERLDPFED